jgi:GDPmannose 4,6-dehydratase
VVLEAVKIKLGLSNELVLGNLNAMRDWGHAKDYVKGMWLMLQQENADDYILATGVSKSVLDLVNYVFNKLDLDVDSYVKSDSKFERAEELHYLRGDSSKARLELGWEPSYTFETMLDEMIENWMDLFICKTDNLYVSY